MIEGNNNGEKQKKGLAEEVWVESSHRQIFIEHLLLTVLKRRKDKEKEAGIFPSFEKKFGGKTEQLGSKVHQTDSIGTNAIEHIDVIYGTISYNAITSVK